MRWCIPALLGASLVGCSSDYVTLNVEVVIPAEVRTIQAGELHLMLWSYDPNIADVGATLKDADRKPFSHEAGRRTVVRMRVAGQIDAGWRYYIGVDGCEGSEAVLWDGIQDASTPPPRVIEMQARTAPAPCSTHFLETRDQ